MNLQKPRKPGSRKIADFHAFVEMKTHTGGLVYAIVWTSGDDGRTARAFHIEPDMFPKRLIRAIASGAGHNAEKFANHANFINRRCRLGTRFDKRRGKRGTCPTCGHVYRVDDESDDPPRRTFTYGKGTAIKPPKPGHTGQSTENAADDTKD